MTRMIYTRGRQILICSTCERLICFLRAESSYDTIIYQKTLDGEIEGPCTYTHKDHNIFPVDNKLMELFGKKDFQGMKEYIAIRKLEDGK